MSNCQQRCRSIFCPCNRHSVLVYVVSVCFLSWVTGSLREQHSKVTAMRSSACVVMATKAVAALLRNKMAGVVSLSLLLLLLLLPPSLSSFSLVSVNWSRLVVTLSPLHPCPVLPFHFAPYSVPPTVHSHSTHVSQQWAGAATLDMIKVIVWVLFCPPHPLYRELSCCPHS